MLNADYPATHVNLGNLHLERGEFDRAVASYKKAVEIEPAFIPGYINLADVYRLQNQDEKGRSILLHALDIAPESASAHHALSLLMIRTGEQKKPCTICVGPQYVPRRMRDIATSMGLR